MASYLDHRDHLQVHRDLQAGRPKPAARVIATREEVAAELERAIQYAHELETCLKQMAPATTDYVSARFPGSGREYIYQVASQPSARRVQVGDLITVPRTAPSGTPRILRVTKVNVPRPKGLGIKSCVAISPEDAARIERVVGTVL